MKQRILANMVMLSSLMTSCAYEMEEVPDITQGETLNQVESFFTRALDCDPLELGNPVQWEPTEEMLRLKEMYTETLSMTPQMAPTLSDDFFSSNIYAIRELPITIKVRSVASGSSASNCYFKCDGANKEVTLSNSSTSNDSKFYLKVLPASSGIPYLLYSNVSRTPLCVGYYESYPDNKILMSAANDSGSLSVSWDLLPSSSHKGYFAIQSKYYLGQTNPDDMWSTFYYVLEAKASDKIGYSQKVENKAQQDFLISTINSFNLENVEYDLANATITESTMVSKVSSLTNTLEIPNRVQVNVSFTANETSNYSEIAGNLSLNIKTPSSIMLQRPIPIAGQAVLQDDIAPDASYSSTTQSISKTIEYVTTIEMKPRSLLQLTTKFKTFNLTVPYVATATYNDREVKVRGIWRGYAIANPDYNAPINEPHFYNLETGEEMYYSMEFDEIRNIYVIQ